MKYPFTILAVLALVASVFSADPTSGQWLFQKKNAGAGFSNFGVTPVVSQAFALDGSGNPTMVAVGAGTVTSVALTLPSAIFDVAGSPITSNGTLAVTLDTQVANTILAGPATGGDAAPTFRTLVAADIPSLTATYATAAQGVKADNVGAISGIIMSNGSASFSAAVAGTDYVAPNGSITGNAATATALETARTINGVSFNGTANITVTAAAGTLTGSSLNSGVTAAPGLLSAAGGSFGTAAFTAATDYATAAQGTKADNAGAVNGLLKSNGSATFAAAVAGTDYLAPAAIGVTVQAFSSALGTFASNGSAFYLARANHTGTQAWSTITSTPTNLAGYGITDAQPLDSDLTAIAALTTTSFGRGLLTETDALSARATLGVSIDLDVQAYNANLDAIAALLSVQSFGLSLLELNDASALRSSAGLGTVATLNTGTASGNVPVLGTGGDLVLAANAKVVLSRSNTGSITPPGGSGFTSARTFTLPDASGIFVLDTATQTLTNKTLVSPALGTPSSLTLTNATGLPTAGLVDDAVTNTKAANMADATIKGRAAGAGTGDPTDLTADQTSTILDGATDPFVRTSAIGGGGASLSANNVFTRGQTITQGTANEAILASTGYSLTGSDATSMLSMAGTLNTSGSPNVIYSNITNTASGASTRLMRLDVGGAHRFSVDKDGTLRFGANSHAIQDFGGSVAGIEVGGTLMVSFNIGSGMLIYNGGAINLNGFGSCIITRDGADHIIAMRSGANAQNFRVYNTYTDATTHERLNFGWSSNVGIIGTEKGSVGGTARDFAIQTDGTTRVLVKATGEVELASGARILSGTGTPESAVTAPVGSIYLRTDGGAGTSFYVKESGSGNTGWAAK